MQKLTSDGHQTVKGHTKNASYLAPTSFSTLEIPRLIGFLVRQKKFLLVNFSPSGVLRAKRFF